MNGLLPLPLFTDLVKVNAFAVIAKIVRVAVNDEIFHRAFFIQANLFLFSVPHPKNEMNFLSHVIFNSWTTLSMNQNA